MNNIIATKNFNNNYTSPNFEKRKEMQVIDKNPQEKLDRIYRSQGFIGKLSDKIQGALNFEYSKKNLQKEVKENKKGINKKLDKYYDRQKNVTEMTIDLTTGVLAAGSYRFIKKIQSYTHLYAKNAKFDKISAIAGVGISAIFGMTAKPILKWLNSIGTPRKDKKRERTILKDIGSGFIDGLTAPIAYVYKFGLAIPVAINSVSRYIFNKKADKDSGFSEHLGSNLAVKIPLLGVAAFSAVKFHKGVDKIENAIVKAKSNIANIQVHESKMPLSELLDLAKTNIKDEKTKKDLLDKVKSNFSIFKTLYRVIFKKKDLVKENELNALMKDIEQYNIFYPKMLQSMPSNIGDMLELIGGKNLESILGGSELNTENMGWFKRKMTNFLSNRKKYIIENGIKSINDFLNKYKSCCPSSRTVEEAQEYISKTFGKKYILQGNKPLGVGTIAESYLAKDTESGKDVVIKIVKKWVSAEKLNKDKQKMLEIIKRMKGKLGDDDYNYQCKLVDELYKAWSKEIDLNLEADAAKILGKYAVNYNTAAPITVKNNIFVMERAKGVQFDKFVDYLKENNIELSKDEFSSLIVKYLQVFFEQLLSVPQKGSKVLHADPHAGNIFIDLNNKEKPFTFIDTGNVMRFTPEEAIRNVTSHMDYLIGNSKNIALRLVKGAILPEGMTEKKAAEMLSKHLDETFFSGKYKIRKSDPFSAINNEAMEYMKNNKIILNANNTNLIKAELTYIMNMISLNGIGKHIDKNSMINEELQKKNMEIMGKQILESIKNGILNNKTCTIKEIWQRYKYIKDNPEQFFTTLYSYIPPNV